MDMSFDLNTLGALFELSRDAVIGLEDNRICFVNPQAQRLLGLTCNGTADEFLPSDLLEEEADRFVTQREIGGHFFTISVRRMGSIRLICLCEQDRSSELKTVSANIKAVREMSESLMELRMAMNAIMRSCEKETKKKLTGYAAILYRDYYRLQRLCNHLSTAVNISDGTLPYDPQVIQLDKTVRNLTESINTFSDSFRATLRLDIPSGNFSTYADETQIETMVLNLITNSLLHCEKGGVVSVSLQKKNKRFILSVNDNGSGMSADKLMHVFDGNAQNELTDSNAGAGLGLFVAQGIAERHGGNILIESRPEGGSRVRVSLPQREPPILSFHSPSPPDTVGSMNLLLTELSVLLPEKCYISRFLD